MSKLPAYVLQCGCRFFGGNASMCPKHSYNRVQARRNLRALAVGVAVGVAVVVALSILGCAVDTGGTVDDYESDASLLRGDSGNPDGLDSGLELPGDASVPQDVATDRDSDVGPEEQPPMDGPGGTDSGGAACPKTNSVNGCAPGLLAYPTGVIVCCVPVDWEGYRAHCPQPFEGCRWKYGSFDGWTGECCG